MKTKLGTRILPQSLGMHWSWCQKVKVQGHVIIKTIAVAWLLVQYAAAAASVGLHIVWLLKFLVKMALVLTYLLLMLGVPVFGKGEHDCQ